METTAKETLALGKVVKTAAMNKARAELGAGEYTVDMLIRVTGGVKVGEDYDQHIVAKADAWGLLTAALNKLNGVTVEALIRDAENMEADAIKETKTATEKAMEKIKGKTLTTCKGKVTTNLTFEKIEKRANVCELNPRT